LGATRVSVEPTALKRPANGVGMAPNASHGVDARSFCSEAVAWSALIGTGLLPPSMYTSPDRPRAALPPKSQVA
jgi:hypothetical protein